MFMIEHCDTFASRTPFAVSLSLWRAGFWWDQLHSDIEALPLPGRLQVTGEKWQQICTSKYIKIYQIFKIQRQQHHFFWIMSCWFIFHFALIKIHLPSPLFRLRCFILKPWNWSKEKWSHLFVRATLPTMLLQRHLPIPKCLHDWSGLGFWRGAQR